MENKLLNNLNLISISGCGHSGTTLTATVLGAHKNLLLIPIETRMFLDESYDINNFIFNNYSNKKTMIIEKTPNHIYVLDKIKKEATKKQRSKQTKKQLQQQPNKEASKEANK